MQVGLGFSKKREIHLAAEEALWQAKAQIGQEKIDLAIVFSSIEFATNVLLRTLEGYLQDTPIIGCSSAAIIFNSNIYKNGLALLLISAKDVSLSFAAVKEIKKRGAAVAGQELGDNLLQNFRGTKRDLAMIFCDGLMEEGSKLILGLQQKLGTSFPIAGASASDNLKFNKTFLYFNHEVITDAVVGILWGGKLNFALSLKHGWKPLGKPRFVTMSEGNIINEIDNQPAVDLYKDYFAKDVPDLKRELKYISTLYPIGIYLAGEEEYLLRNIISINSDGSLTCQGEVPSASQIRLMIGTKESCLLATRQAAQETKKNFFLLKSELLPKVQDIKILFVFDSVSRYILLRRNAIEELRIIREMFGEDIPLVGLYTYGEQAPLKAITYQGRAHFHNQTIIVTALGG